MSGVTDQLEPLEGRSCHFERGQRNEVAIVLSCPGSREAKNNRPASGVTGNNLKLFLAKLGPLIGFDNLVRSDVTVTNAFTGVEYKGKGGTGRSEARFEEILQEVNISRLNAELAEISDLVIFCGARATAVSKLVVLRPGTKAACIPHLGMQGINQIAGDVGGAPILSVAESKAAGDKRSAKEIGRDNTSKRIEVLVQLALQQIK